MEKFKLPRKKKKWLKKQRIRVSISPLATKADTPSIIRAMYMWARDLHFNRNRGVITESSK